EAEAMHQRAPQGYEKALGRDHTSTLRTVHNLGALYSDQGRPRRKRCGTGAEQRRLQDQKTRSTVSLLFFLW
ncbi:hypothetical protein C8A03DRAFT_19946, partial [Achaetomium macrosporum]